MKLNSTIVLIALAFAGATASAATLEQFTLPDNTTAANPSVGPAGVSAHGNFNAAAPVDDAYDFNLAAASDLFTYAHEFESLDLSLDPANFALFTGSYGDAGATQIGQTFSFAGGSALTTTYSNLVAGNYYFEIEGAAVGHLGADYDFAIFANAPANPLPAVPEPANAALLLAGLGMVGFLVKRRSHQ